MRWYQCYRKGAAEYGIDGFANRKRVGHLTAAGFTQVSERFFKCYMHEDAVRDAEEKAVAKLMRQNVMGLLDSVTNTMQERAQWDVIGVSRFELDRLKEDAKNDIVRNAASRRYHWV